MSAAAAPDPIDTSTTTSRARWSPPGSARPRWDEIAERAPQVVATMIAYLDQLTVSSRPATVSAASLVLRQFADHLTSTDPACTSVAAVERRHVESYKIALAARPGRDGGTVDHRDDPQQPRDAAHLLRADHRLGRPRRTTPSPGARR